MGRSAFKHKDVGTEITYAEYHANDGHEGVLDVARGGTGLSAFAAGGILYISADNTLVRIAPAAANRVLRSTGANALEIGVLVTADIPELDTGKITTGVFALARIPTMDDAHVPDLETLSYGAAFAVAQIPDLPASKITSGRFGMARMPDGASGFLEAAGTGADPVYNALVEGDIPNLPASKITSGAFDLARIPTPLTGKDADSVDGAEPGLSDGDVALLPTATEGKILKRGATTWGLSDDEGGIENLSELTIDVNKDWAAKRITNLGAPTAANDALRSDASLRAPDSSKLEGSTKSQVQAHSPQAHKTSHEPGGGDAMTVDAAAGTGSLRTLGTGAQQAAAGNHTHTLIAEAQSITQPGDIKDGYASVGYRHYKTVAADGDLDPFITKTDTFSSASRAIAAMGGCFYSATANCHKIRLFMDGVQVAETGYIGTAQAFYSLLGDRALSGSKVIKVTVHNYGAAAKNIYWYAFSTAAASQHPVLTVGSVKI